MTIYITNVTGKADRLLGVIKRNLKIKMSESVQTQAYYPLEIYSYSIYTCLRFSNEESGQVQRTEAAFIFAHYRNRLV